MISIGNFKTISSEYDEIWFIVRSLKGGVPNTGTIALHVPQLSPKTELFQDYLKWSKNNQWNKEVFNKDYVPRFLEQMKYSTEAKQCLNTLFQKSRAGKNILLVCFCSNEELCHRSIVLGLLQGVGAETNGSDYCHFYDLYKEV